MKRIAVFLFALAFLCVSTGCRTVEYVSPSLPSFRPVVPERPELYELDETAEIPKEVNLNTVLLMGYAEGLENVILSWQVFYDNLRELYPKEL